MTDATRAALEALEDDFIEAMNDATEKTLRAKHANDEKEVDMNKR